MKRPLESYAAKRAFERTPEPSPVIPADRRGPLLFVVQKHAARNTHYDLRLELDGVLKSWAVPKGPSLDTGDKRMAVETEDHPFDYASFEGVIPKGEYGAGRMIVWDCGTYSPDEGQDYAWSDRDAAQRRVRTELARGKLSFFLCGAKLKGSFALVRTSTPKQWLLIKHRDRFAGVNDILARNASVLSGRVVDEVESAERLDAATLAPTGPAEMLPKKLAPMLADVGETAQSDPRYLYEPKLDGYRTLAFVDGGKVRLMSRRGLDLTRAFPEIVAELANQAIDTLIVDGEIVALDTYGRPSFNALQNRAQLKTDAEIATGQREHPVTLVCFDLLHVAGIDVRGRTYVERRRYLQQCLLPAAHLQLVHAAEDGESLYTAALEHGFEGIMAKRRDSVYLPGKRTAAWLKVKATHTAELVVGGYTKGKGARQAIGALLLGFWRGKELHYVGHAGSGLTEEAIADLRARFAKLTRKTAPFVEKPPLHRPTTWLEPVLVAEVSFQDRTADGLLRAPVFLRLRDDVKATSVRQGPQARGTGKALHTPANPIEEILQQLAAPATQLTLAVGRAQIKLTHLDREYWPGDERARLAPITKRDLLRYLAAVSGHMLPHLADRPLTMIRMPEGIDGERFFQKHWDAALPPFVDTVKIFSEHKDEKQDYLVANNLPTLLWLGQIATLEFHVWHSRSKLTRDAVSRSTDFSSSLSALEASVLNYPDYLVFDIDPYIYSGKEAQGAEPELNEKGFAVGKRVAFWLHELLKQMSLDAIVKTSGKTGLHVFVPIERTLTFTEARQVCEMVGRHLMREHPREITMEWAVVKRTGKIFMDYNMNVRGKTLNAAYSPRGVPGAPVSMPLTWEELEAAEPMHFTMRNVLSFLDKNGDRWHDALSSKQNLAKTLRMDVG